MRGKIIAAALGVALVTMLAFLVCSAQRSGVMVRSVDKRMKIYAFQYFPGENMDFSYPPPPRPPSKLEIQWRRLVHKLRLHQSPIIQSPLQLRIQGKGPALVVLGQIVGGDSNWLELVTQDGTTLNQSSPLHALVAETNLFLWNYAFKKVYPFTNGNYRLRFSGETNDLAFVRVR